MIKAISFDFYNTLVRFWPPLDEIQQAEGDANYEDSGMNATGHVTGTNTPADGLVAGQAASKRPGDDRGGGGGHEEKGAEIHSVRFDPCFDKGPGGEPAQSQGGNGI